MQAVINNNEAATKLENLSQYNITNTVAQARETSCMRTSEQIRAEIEDKFGFFPAFFAPAAQNPQVLENLWQQTLSAYLNNPLPLLFKEKLSAYLSRFCAVPYCMICHSCSLRSLGMKAGEVLGLLQSPPPTEEEIDLHLSVLALTPGMLTVFPSNSALEESILYCSIFISLERDSADRCRNELRRLLGPTTYTHLVTFIAYIKTCHVWMEAHPEVAYEADKRVEDNLSALLEDEPDLADFFRNYWERVRRERQSQAQQLAEINERKRTEANLRWQEALLRSMTSASPLAFYVVDNRTDAILYFNHRFCKIWGIEHLEERMQRGELNNSDIIPDCLPVLADVPAFVESCKPLQSEENRVLIEDEIPFVDGRTIRRFSTQVRDEQERYFGRLYLFEDITEKKQLEAQFLRAQRMESIGTLASGIAHDLNNVLAPILMSAQLLQMKISDERSQRLLMTVESNAKRGAALVKQVLSFARGLEGKRTILQVRHLVSEIRQIAKETFPKSIEFYTDMPQDLCTVSGDATQLHQVLMNLCVNARDAMPDGGTLSVSARNIFIDENYARMNLDANVGPYIVISVEDTGTGIPPEIVDRIFEPFFTTKELGRGTGLGLSTVTGIIKSHGGFVKVYSELGRGTQFKVYLPAHEGTEAQQNQDLELPKGQGELILVVDDEAAICEITKTALATYGYKVLSASDGIEAIALYAQHKDEINLVLVDMMMPVMDGSTTIRTLQKINPKVKIIAVSGLASRVMVAAAIGTGVEAFLSKPYTAQELLKTIRDIFSS